MKHCVINFGKGSWYPRGQQRLKDTLRDVKYPGTVFLWNDELQLGCPTHAESPYAFKPRTFEHVAAAGYDTILWCDAAVWAWQDIMPIMEHIDKFGHVFFQAGFNCAEWTSDACLNQMNVTRDQAEKMVHLMACCFGLSMKSEKSRNFLLDFIRYSRDGVSFRGPWNNNDKSASQDPRCRGHRHDQSVASILANRYGMDIIVPHHTFFQYYDNPAHKPFVYGEQNDMSAMNPNVCLLSQGM